MTASFTNATTRTSADDLYYANLLTGSVIDATYSATVMRGLVRNESLAGKPSDTYKFPSWPALTAASVAETTDLANTQIATGGATITVGEVGIMTALSDALTEDDILAGLAEYGAQLGKALADKEDADLAALVASFSNVTGVDTDSLTYADFIAAVRELEARDAPGPYVAVLHPVQLGQLHNDVAANGGAFWGAGTQSNDSRFGQMRRDSRGELAGVNIYATTNVPTGGLTGYYGGIFSQGQALAFVSKREARTEFERDASARLTEIVVTSRYGVGELVDAWGQTVISDTTTA